MPTPTLKDIITEITKTASIKDKTVYSGDLIELQWISLSAKKINPTISLKWGGIFGSQQSIMPYPDAQGKYIQRIRLETTETQQIGFELVVEYQDEHGDDQIQSVSFPTVTLLPASIVSFEAEEEVALGNSNMLSWKAKGKVTAYELKIGNGNWQKLPSSATSYSDQPAEMMTYQLRVYAGTAPALITGASFIANTQVFYPPYQAIPFPKNIDKKGNEAIFGVVLAPDDLKLYVAMSDAILVFETTTDKEVGRIVMPKGQKGILLSSDGTRLYVTDKKTRSLYVILTDSFIIEKSISLKISPKALALNDESKKNAKLYVAGDNSIVTVDLTKGLVLIDEELDLSVQTENKEVSLNIGCLAINLKTARLYATHSNGAIISEITLADKLEYVRDLKVGLNPHDIAIDAENKLYVLNTGDNTVSIVDLAAEDPAESTIKLTPYANNPESLVLGVQGDSTETILHVAGGFTNQMVSINTAQRDKNTVTLVGCNPHKLLLSSDGLKIYALCSDGIYTFWLQRKYINNDRVLIPPQLDLLNQISQISQASAAIMAKETNAEAARQQRDDELRQGPLGLFFPNMRQNEILITPSPSVNPVDTLLQSSTTVASTKMGTIVSSDDLIKEELNKHFKKYSQVLAQETHDFTMELSLIEKRAQKVASLFSNHVENDVLAIHKKLTALLNEKATVAIDAAKNIIVSARKDSVAFVRGLLQEFGITIVKKGEVLVKSVSVKPQSKK